MFNKLLPCYSHRSYFETWFEEASEAEHLEIIADLKRDGILHTEIPLSLPYSYFEYVATCALLNERDEPND